MATTYERFLDKINIEPTEQGCFIYTGTIAQNGYGLFYADGETVYAHRYAYTVSHGEIPTGKVIMHSCIGSRSCCNPAHLNAGTSAENNAQCIAEGRRPKTLTKRRPVTQAELQEIRTRHAAGESAYSIAKSLNRSQPLLSFILRGKIHKPKVGPFPRMQKAA
jgi:HNH endonuclease